MKNDFINKSLVDLFSYSTEISTIRDVRGSSSPCGKTHYINFEMGVDPVSYESFVYKTENNRNYDLTKLNGRMMNISQKS